MFKVSSTPTAIALCPDWLVWGCVLSYIIGWNQFWRSIHVVHEYFCKEIITFKNQLPLLCQFVKINPGLNGWLIRMSFNVSNFFMERFDKEADFQIWLFSKGQLISKCPFGMFKLTKNQRNVSNDFFLAFKKSVRESK